MSHSLAIPVILGAAKSGLTLTASLLNADGSGGPALTTTDLLELAAGTGTYGWFGTIPDGFSGYIQFKSAGNTVFQAATGLNPAPDEAPTAAAVWAYAARTLTQAAAQLAAIVAGTTVTIERGDTVTANFTGLGSLVGRTALYFTAKHVLSDPDSAALLQISELGGLLVLNGAVGTSNQGSLVVTDQNAGSATVTLAAAATALLRPESTAFYDLQVETGATVRTLTQGSLTVVADATRAVT